MGRKLLCCISTIYLLFAAVTGRAQQDKVELLSGKIIFGTISDTSNGDVSILAAKRKRSRLVQLEGSRIFSLTYAGQAETVLYRKDTTIGNFRTPEECRYFIYGERDASNLYNPLGFKICSGLVTLGVSLADTYKKDSVHTSFGSGFFRGEPGFSPLIATFLCTALAGIPSVQINIRKVSDRNYLNHEPYLDGFERVARSKKIFGTLKFSLGGALVGLGSYYLVHSLR